MAQEGKGRVHNDKVPVVVEENDIRNFWAHIWVHVGTAASK